MARLFLQDGEPLTACCQVSAITSRCLKLIPVRGADFSHIMPPYRNPTLEYFAMASSSFPIYPYQIEPSIARPPPQPVPATSPSLGSSTVPRHGHSGAGLQVMGAQVRAGLQLTCLFSRVKVASVHRNLMDEKLRELFFGAGRWMLRHQPSLLAPLVGSALLILLLSLIGPHALDQ